MDDRGTLFDRIRRLGVVSWSLLGLGLLVGVAIWALSRVRVIVPPVAVAIALIYVLNPLVDRLQRRRVPRVVGAIVAYLALGGLLFLAGSLIVPVISSQATDFGERFPDILRAVGDRLVGFFESLGVSVGFTPTMEGLQQWWEQPENRELVLSQLGRLTDLTKGVVETLLLVILAPVLAFYLLIDLPNLLHQARQSLPPRMREEATYLGGRVSRAVGGFVRGQLMVAAIVGILSSIGLWIIDLPFWLLIGLTAGLLNLVPFLGPWVGGILGAVVALATRDATTALWTVLVFVVVQQIDNHLISPIILRVSVQLHPATIMLALLAGATLAGLLGVLLAVPVAAALKIVLVHFWRTRVLGEPWDRATADLVVEHRAGGRDSLLRRLRTIAEPEPAQQPAGGQAEAQDG